MADEEKSGFGDNNNLPQSGGDKRLERYGDLTKLLSAQDFVLCGYDASPVVPRSTVSDGLFTSTQNESSRDYHPSATSVVMSIPTPSPTPTNADVLEAAISL